MGIAGAADTIKMHSISARESLAGSSNFEASDPHMEIKRYAASICHMLVRD